MNFISQNNPQPKKLTPEIIRKIKSLNPSFFTIDDLSDVWKSRAAQAGSGNFIPIPEGETLTLPDGTILSNDKVIEGNGVKHLIMKDTKGKFTGVKIIKPDGKELSEGEIFVGKDGKKYNHSKPKC